MKYLAFSILLIIAGCAYNPYAKVGTAIMEMMETDEGAIFNVYAYHNYYNDRVSYKKVTDFDNKELPFIIHHALWCEGHHCINRDTITVTLTREYVDRHKQGIHLKLHTSDNGKIALFAIQEKNINNLLAVID